MTGFTEDISLLIWQSILEQKHIGKESISVCVTIHEITPELILNTQEN